MSTLLSHHEQINDLESRSRELRTMVVNVVQAFVAMYPQLPVTVRQIGGETTAGSGSHAISTVSITVEIGPALFNNEARRAERS